MKMPDVRGYTNTIAVLDALALLGIFLACYWWAPLWVAIPVGVIALAGVIYLLIRLHWK